MLATWSTATEGVRRDLALSSVFLTNGDSVARRYTRPRPVNTATMIYQNKRKMNIFSLSTLSGMTHMVVSFSKLPDLPIW